MSGREKYCKNLVCRVINEATKQLGYAELRTNQALMVKSFLEGSDIFVGVLRAVANPYVTVCFPTFLTSFEAAIDWNAVCFHCGKPTGSPNEGWGETDDQEKHASVYVGVFTCLWQIVLGRWWTNRYMLWPTKVSTHWYVFIMYSSIS